MTTITESRAAARPLTSADMMSGLVARIAAHLRGRRVLRDLSGMDDHLLRDIGLTRTDVDRATVAEFGTDRMAMLGHARHRRIF